MLLMSAYMDIPSNVVLNELENTDSKEIKHVDKPVGRLEERAGVDPMFCDWYVTKRLANWLNT